MRLGRLSRKRTFSVVRQRHLLEDSRAACVKYKSDKALVWGYTESGIRSIALTQKLSL